VKNATASAKKLKALLKSIDAEPSSEDTPREPLEQLVYAFLLYDTTRKQADQAYPRLMRAMVDINDLRVSDPSDIVAAVGDRYSRALERATNLKTALHSIYLKEHACTLEPLNEMSKRDARQYLESLEGVNPFVIGSVMLLGLGGHAAAVDEQLVRYLKRDDVVDEDATTQEVQAFLEHQVKAAEGLEVHDKLRTYAEATGGGAGSSAGSSKKTSRRSTKKTTKTTSKKPSKKKTTKKTSKKSSKKTAKKTTKKSATRSRS
jgi:endonuclease III